MTKPKKTASFLLLVFCSLVAILVVLTPGGERINTHVDIKTGMTEAEVIALIGGPPGDYSGGKRGARILRGEYVANGR